MATAQTTLESTDTNRPDNCECDGLSGSLPCAPCYLDGFETPARS